MPTDFECLLCGTKFMTNEERKHHLENGTHGHFYDTTNGTHGHFYDTTNEPYFLDKSFYKQSYSSKENHYRNN
jgi:hypothetical protein